MAKKKGNKTSRKGIGAVEFFEDLDERNFDAEKLVEKYAKPIVAVFVVLLLGILGFFAYDQLVTKPKNAEALQEYLTAEKNLLQGKEDEALGGKTTAIPGFLGTYEDFSGTNAGKLAAYNAAALEFKKGNYQRAYDLMDHFKSSNKVLMALKYGLMADSQVNLKNTDKGLSLLDKAISVSDDPFTSYYFTRKAGILAVALKKNSEAKKYFNAIDSKYKDYDGGMSDAYIEMVKYF